MGTRYLEVTHIPARDGGVVHGVVERARDITLRKQSERQLDDAVKELQAKRLANRKYVYSVSHDLKEPVNAITNATRLLTEGALERADPLELRCLRIAAGGQRQALARAGRPAPLQRGGHQRHAHAAAPGPQHLCRGHHGHRR